MNLLHSIELLAQPYIHIGRIVGSVVCSLFGIKPKKKTAPRECSHLWLRKIESFYYKVECKKCKKKFKNIHLTNKYEQHWDEYKLSGLSNNRLINQEPLKYNPKKVVNFIDIPATDIHIGDSRIDGYPIYRSSDRVFYKVDNEGNRILITGI